MRPYQVFNTLEDLRISFEGSLCRAGVQLSADDTQTVLEVYQQWLSLAFDIGYLHPETLLREGLRLWSSMTKVDVLYLNNAMAECAHLVRVRSSNGFKAHCSIISPHLFNIVKEDVGLMIEGNVYAAKRLIQLFSYTNRISLNDIDLSQQLAEEYLQTEDTIPQSFEGPLVSSLNGIIKRWIGPYCPYEIVPQHGPGGVSRLGRCSLFDKYKNLSSDRRLEYAFGDPWWCEGPVQSLDRTSSTIFVPKSYKTFRTISMEPCTLQYFQQGIWKVIDKYVSSHRYLKARISFHEQERNRLLAQRGSIERNYATIDLSHASDSVGYELVKKLFKGTWLLRYIVVLRSPQTQFPDGRIFQLRKFAPMGSALCFPIETLVFAAICEHVTRGLRMSGDYSVFGDDIIVPTSAVETTMRALRNLGFEVNTKKSFVDEACWFRESCGGEYIDGFDVTPMRVSRKYASRERSVRFQKLITMANTAYERNYYCLRHFFLRKLRSLEVSPLFAPTSLLGRSYSNFHLKRRWNVALQRDEVRGSGVKVRRIRLKSQHVRDDVQHEVEMIRYRHWLESTYERRSLEWAFESDVLKPTEYLSYQWYDVSGLCPEQAVSSDDVPWENTL